MRLSVVMTVYNGDRYLQDAIGSVLAQSIADFEFLIVDDASTDRTAEMLAAQQQRDSRIRVLRNSRNLGPYPSLNRALAEARGSIIARQDADDISPPDRFAVQLAAFDSEPNVSLVTGEIDVFDERDGRATSRIRPPESQPRLEWELMFSNVIGGGGHVMFPRLLHQEPIRYATERRYAEDYGLWCRLARLGVVRCPARVVYRYRQHTSSITGQRKAEQAECLDRIRSEYRAPYIPLETPSDEAGELTRFWTADGTRPLAVPARTVQALLRRVGSNFLAYVERRHGGPDRARLEMELRDATIDRLGYWLYRSARMLDARACLDFLSAADGASAPVGGRALHYAVGAVWRKRVPLVNR